MIFLVVFIEFDLENVGGLTETFRRPGSFAFFYYVCLKMVLDQKKSKIWFILYSLGYVEVIVLM